MTVLISIVTGTYNRLGHLKRMVTSTRSSLGKGIVYEIVLVDGGSTDGTIAWAKSQPDVMLIEQGKLLGAVKAFNAGAQAANGQYVILANDDILFGDYTLQAAISFMQDNPKIGVGCFYQDRDGHEPYVDTMPAVVNNTQGRAYYGQVCIVPKYLGDQVGWWGDYLHTYGGDNELSARILELGYGIEPVPCSFIHDLKVSDGLRAINAQHPDSNKFYQKWTRLDGLVGPEIPNNKKVVIIPRYRRIFYAPIYEMPHRIQYDTKRGLRDALARIGLVQECDYVNSPRDAIIDMACAIDPDVFVMQVQDWRIMTAEVIRLLRKNHPKAVFVNWNGDFHPETLMDSEYMKLMRMFDHCGFVTTDMGPRYTKFGINWFYWQIGFEPTDALPDVSTPRHDILFLGNCYSAARTNLADFLMGTGLNVGLYGSWPAKYRPAGSNLYDFNSGAKLYRACKIAIGDSQWPNAGGFVSNRLFQAMEAGAFMMHQRFSGAEELLGLKDGVHLIMWDNLQDLRVLIEEWLKPSMASKRRSIAETGQRYILENHSFDNRVKELATRLGWNV